ETFKPAEEFGMGGMVVNYGTSVTGMGTDYTSLEEPSVAENANGVRPDKVNPNQQINQTKSGQSTDKDIFTQNSEDAVGINSGSNHSTSNPSLTSENNTTVQAVNQNALYKGKRNNGTGAGDGTGASPGNQGSVNGDPNASNYGEGGSGNGNAPIPLRRFTNLVSPEDDGQTTGKVAVRITINKSGLVTNAVAGVKGTTVSDKELWEKCRNAVLGATLNRSERGLENQIGVVIFNFKVK
ncbi:MAG: energy transducer TonB, partial [Sphingobacteriaceae bacterium]|nr:energy transducer TonB [Sphingobacteriaceae bacterium]